MRQVAERYHSRVGGTTIGYLVHVPAALAGAAPLLVFLHGAGERGDGGRELARLANHGPPRLVEAGRDLPFVVVSPQLPRSLVGWEPELVDEFVARMRAEHRPDEERLYVTGISMGGFGTWMYACRHPRTVAAIVPICGGGYPREACALRRTPVWAFHGDRDYVVDVEYTRAMVDALLACDPPPEPAPRLTIYPGVGHDSWTRTYDGSAGHDVFAWLLGHRRRGGPAAPAAPASPG